MTSPTPRLASAAPSARFGGSLPAGIREDAETMSWSVFTDTYAPGAGPVRLGHWECADGRGASRLGPQPCTFRAALGFGDRIETVTATASGPIAALTAMLYEHGIAVETLRFHQLRSQDDVATFIQGSDGARAEWAMGCAQDPTQSALRAVIACANRLYFSGRKSAGKAPGKVAGKGARG